LEVDVLVSSPEYGRVPEELATLQNLVKFHKMKVPLMISKLNDLRVESQFHTDWYKWNRASIGKDYCKIRRNGPKAYFE